MCATIPSLWLCYRNADDTPFFLPPSEQCRDRQSRLVYRSFIYEACGLLSSASVLGFFKIQPELSFNSRRELRRGHRHHVAQGTPCRNCLCGLFKVPWPLHSLMATAAIRAEVRALHWKPWHLELRYFYVNENKKITPVIVTLPIENLCSNPATSL